MKRTWITFRLFFLSILSAAIVTPELTFATPPTGDGPVMFAIRKGGSYLELPQSGAFDPQPGRPFVVSTLFRLRWLPDRGVRNSLVLNYNPFEYPNSGWAIGMQRFQTSFRIEVYWKDENNKGGWYTLESTKLNARRWYVLTLVVYPEKVLAVYLSPYKVTKDGASDLSSGDIQYLGAVSVESLGLPRSTFKTRVGAAKSSSEAFRGEIAGLIISSPERLPRKREEVGTLISQLFNPSENSSEVISALKGAASIYLDRSPRDLSASKIEPKLVGSVELMHFAK